MGRAVADSGRWSAAGDCGLCFIGIGSTLDDCPGAASEFGDEWEYSRYGDGAGGRFGGAAQRPLFGTAVHDR